MKIGIYTQHPGVIWENETSSPRALQQISRTVLGNVSIYQIPISKKEIVISAKDMGTKARGYFARDTIEYLLNAEYTKAVVVFEYRGVSYNTNIVAGGVNVIPKKETEQVTSSDPYTGTITLMEI